jgi:hypothetical protein
MASLTKTLGLRLFLLGKTWSNKEASKFNHDMLGSLMDQGPRGSPIGMLPGWALGWTTIYWRTWDKVAWTSSYYQINLVGLQGKLHSVIGLWLFYCNRLGLVSCPAFYPYIKRGMVHAPFTHTIIQSIQRKGLCQLDVNAITWNRAQTSINRLSLCVTIKFYVRRSPSNIAPGTPVASCRTSNTDKL